MAGYTSPGGGGFDYVQPGEPNNPQLGDLWFDTDAGSDGSGEAKVYDSTGWVVTGYASHTDLMDIGADDHHSPVTVSDPLTEDGTQDLGLSIGDGVTLSGGTLVAALSTGLTIDGGGNVRVAADGITNELLAADAVDATQIVAGAVGTTELGFDPATQSELDAHVGDAGAHHTPPDVLAVVDAAETFTEGDVTVSTSGTRVDNGAIKLTTQPGESVTTGYDGTSANADTGMGVEISPAHQLEGLTVTAFNQDISGGATVYLAESDGTVLDSGSISTGATVELSGTLLDTQTYHVYIEDGTSTAPYGDVNFPVSCPDFDVTAEVSQSGSVGDFNRGGIDQIWNFAEIEAIVSAQSGSATVEFDDVPVESWDSASVQAAANGGSVAVYIEEENGGWSEVAGPISRGDAIPASASNDVRFRVELSIPSPGDTAPEVFGLYRRRLV